MNNPQTHSKRVLILTTAQSYRVTAFLKAAAQLNVEILQAVNMPTQLAKYWDFKLGVDFNNLDHAVDTIVAAAVERPFTAILAIDDSGALLAARASAALGLHHNAAIAAEAARDKYAMRKLLAAGGAPVPMFTHFELSDSIEYVCDVVAAEIGYPCVVKPLRLSGSRGVMRVNDGMELKTAVSRLGGLLQLMDNQSGADSFLVEQYIPGVEVALEGMLDNGRLQLLALFDKPDPLEGPFFEETIYVTPSRLPQAVQDAIEAATFQAATALGLRMGPIHAELRVNEDGPWIVEVAGRSIGGLCSQTLRFDQDRSLETLILMQACGLEMRPPRREGVASGVMMIPIPTAGLLRGYGGVEEATAVSLIEEVTITTPLNNRLVQLPEGESYLGFIFARGKTPEAVEAALRQAHGLLTFDIDVEIPLIAVRN
ncbi:MAG: ATP-grasp domain-containing protein [Chloroflexi bacterium]|nr:ATP-grasp domain-containing protein [Chloroflexota bacterium]